MKKKPIAETVILTSGKEAKKKGATVRDIANAENQPKGKEYLSKYAVMAAKLLIDGKPIVLEDLLDLPDDDLETIADLFLSEEDLKNA